MTSSAALLARLAEAAPRLNRAAVDEEYRDPFWIARFGERGRRFALEDGLHHFTYAGEALAAGDLAIIESYARWLRSLLVLRGMCTAHLADAFRIRARLVAAEGWPEGAAVVAVFEAAERALAGREGIAGVVERLAAELVAEVPGSRHLVSYLVDALAVGDSAIFTRHVAWLREKDAAATASLVAALRGALARRRLADEVLHFVDAKESAA